MYLGDVYTHLKPRPWVCNTPFPALKGGLFYEAFVFLGAQPGAVAAVSAVSDDTCGGNCPNGCSSCPCGSSVTPVDPSHFCNLGSLPTQLRL